MTPSHIPGTEQEMAVLFADVSGSTRLYEQLGDARAFAAISRCLDILRQVTGRFRGRVVKTIGDEIMAVFPDAEMAVQAACQMQTEVDAMPIIEQSRVAIRIGFHFGSVIENLSDGDVFGDTVNVAARMSSIAMGGQIIASEQTVLRLPPVMRASTRLLDALSVKGKSEDIRVCEVIWRESDDATMMVGRTLTPPPAQTTLRLVHGDQVLTMDASRSRITIGRDETADIVIADKRASRLHASIERRRDKFVFIDQSSNGSYLTIRGEDEIALRREEFVLRGNGSISLGHAYSKDPSEVIEFYCQS